MKINNDIDITFSVEWTITIYLYASCILCNRGKIGVTRTEVDMSSLVAHSMCYS